jgi:hypothetical protein
MTRKTLDVCGEIVFVMILILCGVAAILAVGALYFRSTENNPVDKRVNRSLKRMAAHGLPCAVPVEPKGYTHEDLMPKSSTPAQTMSSPAWA